MRQKGMELSYYERVVFTKDNIDKYNFSRQKRPNISDVFISSLIMNSFFFV